LNELKHLRSHTATTPQTGFISLLANHAKKFFHALTQRKNNNLMKQLQTSLLLVLSLAVASAYAQATKSPPAAGASASTPPTIASAIDREISLVEKEVVEVAEAMPEDKFDFSPEKLNLPGSNYKGVRTFGEQLKHIAASNYLIWSPITGEKPPDTVNDGKGPDNMKAKADIIKYLKDSFAFGHKAVATLNSSNLVEPITSSSGRQTTRLFLATFAAAHCFDHYGQMIEYLRMNGIVPPASRGK
jgi:uncharacterized damage-inducible protein DinB